MVLSQMGNAENTSEISLNSSTAYWSSHCYWRVGSHVCSRCLLYYTVVHRGCWCRCPHAATLIHAVKAVRRCYSGLLSRFVPFISFCPINSAQCHSTEPELDPLLDKCRLGCSGMCRSASSARNLQDKLVPSPFLWCLLQEWKGEAQ